MKATLITLLICLYIQIAVPHRLLPGGITRHRQLRPIIAALSQQRQVPLPILTMKKYLKPYKFSGLVKRRPAKPFHFMNKYFTKRVKPRKLNMPRHLSLKPAVLNQPRNMHRLGLRKTGPPGIPGNFGRFGIPQLPVTFSRHTQTAGRRIEVRRNRAPTFGPGVFGVRRGTVLGARPEPFRFPIRTEGFDDFDFEIPDSRITDTDIFDDLNDIDDTFDERFEEGFGTIGRLSRRKETSNFNRDALRTRPTIAGGFGLNFNPLPQRRGDMKINDVTDMALRDNLGPHGRFNRFNEQFSAPVPDFGDNRFTEQLPDFVDDLLDSDKVDIERIEEKFDRDDRHHGGIQSKIDTKSQPTSGIITDDDVPDLVDIDDSSKKTIIQGFEMLGDRRNNRASDIINIFQGDLFDFPTDPFSKRRSDDDKGQLDDENRIGTFALLGIDPASLGPIPGDNSGPGVVTANSPQAESKDSIPVKWPLDLGFSNDANMNIVLNEIPSPSSL